MNSITAALTWEYFARNRWGLLLFPFLANLMPMIVLGALSSYQVSLASPAFIGIYPGFVLTAIVILCFGTGITQGSIARLYLKPTSTMAIVSFYFWFGALLVGSQVLLSVVLWNILFHTEWPLAGPTIFAIVSWCAFQPILRVSPKSIFGVAANSIVLIGLFYWFVTRHGDINNTVKTMWTSISGLDLLTAGLVIGCSYAATIWRVTNDRSGRSFSRNLVSWRFTWEAWFPQQHRFINPFANVAQALRWLDFQTRTFMMPLLVCTLQAIFWLAALAVAAYYQDTELGISTLLIGANFTLFIEWIVAFVSGIVMVECYEWHSGRKMRGNDQVAMHPSDYRLSHYLLSLPISPSQMARGMLSSSAIAVGISFAAILATMLLLYAWSFVSGFNLGVMQQELKQPLWKLAILATLAFIVGPFALMNNLASLVLVIPRFHYSVVIIMGLIVLFALFPLPTSIALCAVALALLIGCNLQAIRHQHIAPLQASIALLVGLTLAGGLYLILPPEIVLVKSLISAFVGVLTILPITSLPLALQYSRST